MVGQFQALHNGHKVGPTDAQSNNEWDNCVTSWFVVVMGDPSCSLAPGRASSAKRESRPGFLPLLRSLGRAVALSPISVISFLRTPVRRRAVVFVGNENRQHKREPMSHHSRETRNYGRVRPFSDQLTRRYNRGSSLLLQHLRKPVLTPDVCGLACLRCTASLRCIVSQYYFLYGYSDCTSLTLLPFPILPS